MTRSDDPVSTNAAAPGGSQPESVDAAALPTPANEAAGPAPAEEDPAAMKEQLARFREERDDLVGSLQRLQADFENFRKRNARERAEDFARATALVLESLLPVLDAFERAFASEMDPSQNDVRRGFELIHKQLVDVLTQHGLSRIEALGQPFDPHLHQAVERLETSEVPEGTIVEELRSGYKVRDRVVRPAMVRVAVAPAGVAAGDSPKVN